MDEYETEVVEMNKTDTLAFLELIEIAVEKSQSKEEALEAIRRVKQSVKNPQ